MASVIFINRLQQKMLNIYNFIVQINASKLLKIEEHKNFNKKRKLNYIDMYKFLFYQFN